MNDCSELIEANMLGHVLLGKESRGRPKYRINIHVTLIGYLCRNEDIVGDHKVAPQGPSNTNYSICSAWV